MWERTNDFQGGGFKSGVSISKNLHTKNNSHVLWGNNFLGEQFKSQNVRICALKLVHIYFHGSWGGMIF